MWLKTQDSRASRTLGWIVATQGPDEISNSPAITPSVALSLTDATDDKLQVGPRRRMMINQRNQKEKPRAQGNGWTGRRWVGLENEPGLLSYWPFFFICLPDSLEQPSLTTPAFPSPFVLRHPFLIPLVPSEPPPPPPAPPPPQLWQITCSWTLLRNLGSA